MKKPVSKISKLKQKLKLQDKGADAFAKAQIIKKEFPEEAKMIIQEADMLILGEIVLPGTGAKPVNLGTPIQWNYNPTGNAEYTFQLNRLINLKTIAEAYSLTYDKKYSDYVFNELLNWIDTVKRPNLYEKGELKKNNFDGPESGAWRALEVGIRCYRTLPIIISIIAFSPDFTEEFLIKLLKSIQEHIEILFKISPLLWPDANHNHYLMENLGLLYMTALFPELEYAEKGLKQAQKELDRCLKNQVTKHGGQIEGCPSYHNGCLYWFALRKIIADKYELNVPSQYSSALKKMFNYSVHATRNFGTNIPWGDSSTGPNGTLLHAAIAMYLAYGDISYIQIALYFYSYKELRNEIKENLFIFADVKKLKTDLAKAKATPKKPMLPLFFYEKELNQVFIRNSWNKEGLTLMTACRTPVQNRHAHIDPAGFDLSVFGTSLIADPGKYTYKDGIDRYHFKCTAWHNCITINGKDAWEYKGSWAYGPQKKGIVTSVQHNCYLSRIETIHENYYPAILSRIFFIFKAGYLVILDIIDNIDNAALIDINFHLNSDSILMYNNTITSNRTPGIIIQVSNNLNFSIEQGKISDAVDTWHDSTIIHYHFQPAEKKFVNATLLYPYQSFPPFYTNISTNIEKGKINILYQIDNKKRELTYEPRSNSNR